MPGREDNTGTDLGATLQDDTPPLTLDYPDSELVFGLVYAVGTEHKGVQSVMEDRIRLSRFEPQTIRLSEHLPYLARKLGVDVGIPAQDECERINRLMDAGNDVRRMSGRADFLAMVASSFIASSRARTEGGDPVAG